MVRCKMLSKVHYKCIVRISSQGGHFLGNTHFLSQRFRAGTSSMHVREQRRFDRCHLNSVKQHKRELQSDQFDEALTEHVCMRQHIYDISSPLHSDTHPIIYVLFLSSFYAVSTAAHTPPQMHVFTTEIVETL